ncbi:MAG TPA: triose-phosphate isomerase [Actinomycetota bacterium]|nr:triose-phosphate isomerase [Actinomycetota bacterium]
MSRRPIMAANWKMNKTHIEAIHFVEEFRNRVEQKGINRSDIVICPPFTALRSVQTVLDAEDLEFKLGAQNMYSEDNGAYTGEVSGPMLTKLGVKYVILGHSERRDYFQESDEAVNLKVKAAFRNGLIPICCVGESLREREEGFTNQKVEWQIVHSLEGLTDEQIAGMIIAYEPIWAIGTGKTATPQDAQDTISVIRMVVRDQHPDAADRVRIQYGGSVNPGNIDDLMAQPDIDGALVGGASLDPVQFARIVMFE